MSSTKSDQSSSFLVTKHSWKGKYRRVLTLSPDTFSTFNPSSMETTNAWKITDIVGLHPAPSAPGTPQQGQVSEAKIERFLESSLQIIRHIFLHLFFRVLHLNFNWCFEKVEKMIRCDFLLSGGPWLLLRHFGSLAVLVTNLHLLRYIKFFEIQILMSYSFSFFIDMVRV